MLCVTFLHLVVKLRRAFQRFRVRFRPAARNMLSHLPACRMATPSLALHTNSPVFTGLSISRIPERYTYQTMEFALLLLSSSISSVLDLDSDPNKPRTICQPLYLTAGE